MNDQILPFVPVGPTLIVVPRKTEPPKTASGIQLADVYDQPETSGMVIAIGTGFRCACCDKMREPEFQIGDFVMFDKASGEILPLDIEGRECLLLREEEILAVVNPQAVCEVV